MEIFVGPILCWLFWRFFRFVFLSSILGRWLVGRPLFRLDVTIVKASEVSQLWLLFTLPPSPGVGTKVLRSAIETPPIIFRVLSHDLTLVCSIVGTVYVMNVFIIAASKILTTRTKRPAIGTKSGRRFIYRPRKRRPNFSNIRTAYGVFDSFGAGDDSLNHDKQKK